MDYNKTITLGKWEITFKSFDLEQEKHPWFWHIVYINEKGYWRPESWSGDYKLGMNGDCRITNWTRWFAWMYAFVDALFDFDSPRSSREPTPEVK